MCKDYWKGFYTYSLPRANDMLFLYGLFPVISPDDLSGIKGLGLGDAGPLLSWCWISLYSFTSTPIGWPLIAFFLSWNRSRVLGATPNVPSRRRCYHPWWRAQCFLIPFSEYLFTLTSSVCPGHSCIILLFKFHQFIRVPVWIRPTANILHWGKMALWFTL